MKNFYRRGMLIIMFLLAMGFLVMLAMSQAKAATPINHPISLQNQVTGTVSDQYGDPLLGVTVLVKNAQYGTTTNSFGEYELTASPEDTLVFSFIGYKTQQIPIKGRGQVNIQMVEDISSLNEVEINAGYYNVTERERTGNISRVTSEEIDKQPITNPLAALQGRMAGVNITQTSGVPGGGFDIQIRGINSINSGIDPLYIIDGVPYASQSLGYNQTSTVFPGTNSPLNAINPSDIESIEILKDADATAIYGSRGANGVVLITTKKGSFGKTQLSLELNSGISVISSRADLMNTPQYLEMRREAYVNDGIEEFPSNAYDVNGTWDQNKYIDWQEGLIGGKALQNNANLRFTGGNEKNTFLLGGAWHKETTVFPGDNSYRKISAIANFSHNSEDDKLIIDFSGNFIIDKNDLPAFDLTRYTKNLAPNAPDLYNDDGSLNDDPTWRNPLRFYANQRYDVTNKNLISSAKISYNITKGLSVFSNLGYNTFSIYETRKLPSTIYSPSSGLDSRYSAVISNEGDRQSWIIEPQLKWQKTYGNWKLNLLLGATLQEQNESRVSLYSEGFPSNELIDDISAASFLAVLENFDTNYKYQAFFARTNFNYAGKYILNLTGRRDGSSRFGPGNRFSNFGAIGGA
ncbi:MAG: SusC/RagA family TonB-linked outer membrane protein, partial [Flavobacteriaceae bacterium]|nr:SusC/RagA family TonB-linked outer membrane protein [Flavobacteriaceae bacterium]